MEIPTKTFNTRKTFLLFAGSALAAILMPGFSTWTLLQKLIVLSIPASASAAMMILGTAFPALFGYARRKFPTCFTLPIVHASLMATVVALGTTTRFGIQKPFEAFSPVLSWLTFRALGLSLIFQAVILFIDATLSNSREKKG